MIREKNTPTHKKQQQQHECNQNHDQTGIEKYFGANDPKEEVEFIPVPHVCFDLTESYTNYMGQGENTLQLQKQRSRGETLVA